MLSRTCELPTTEARGELDRWTLLVRMAGEGAGAREARLEGLAGGTRVAEALRLAAEALGVEPAALQQAAADSEVSV